MHYKTHYGETRLIGKKDWIEIKNVKIKFLASTESKITSTSTW